MIDQQATKVRRKRYDRIAPFYDLMELMNERRMRPWREKLWAQVPPAYVLEVGVGTGKNFEHHPKGAGMTGIDFSPRMLERARRCTAELSDPIELRQMDAQAIEFPDASFDAAVATCVFCSVPDPVQGLREFQARRQAWWPHLFDGAYAALQSHYRRGDGCPDPADALDGARHQSPHAGQHPRRRIGD